VPEKATRRKFSAKYKARILEKADACKGKYGALGELLRKEGLFSSQIAAWRKQREKGQMKGLVPKKRGRKGSAKPSKSQREKELERENRRLLRRNEKLEIMLEIQKKTSELLGIPMEPLDLDEKK
jgi:transposase-like protein